MKKITVLFLATLMVFSIFTLSACDENTAETQTNIGFSFETSSDAFISFPDVVVSSDATTSPNTSEEPQTSTTEPTSTDPGFSFNYSGGSNHTVPQTTVDPTLPANVQAAMRAINNIGTVSYSNITAQKIQFAQAMITAAGGNSNVPNYNDFVQAKSAYDSIAIEGFKQYVQNLKTNFSASASYKAGLDSALDTYTSLSSTAQGQVSTEKTELDRLTLLYSDTLVVNEFKTKYATLPEGTTGLTSAQKLAILQLDEERAKLTSSQKAIIENYSTIDARITTFVSSLNAKEWICSDTTRYGTDFFSTGGEKLATTSDGADITYKGTTMSLGIRLDSGDVTFTPTADSVLIMYLTGKKASSTMEVKQNGVAIYTYSTPTYDSSDDVESHKIEIPIPGGSPVTLHHAGGDRFIMFVLLLV